MFFLRLKWSSKYFVDDNQWCPTTLMSGKVWKQYADDSDEVVSKEEEVLFSHDFFKTTKLVVSPVDFLTHFFLPRSIRLG